MGGFWPSTPAAGGPAATGSKVGFAKNACESTMALGIESNTANASTEDTPTIFSGLGDFFFHAEFFAARALGTQNRQTGRKIFVSAGNRGFPARNSPSREKRGLTMAAEPLRIISARENAS